MTSVRLPSALLSLVIYILGCDRSYGNSSSHKVIFSSEVESHLTYETSSLTFQEIYITDTAFQTNVQSLTNRTSIFPYQNNVEPYVYSSNSRLQTDIDHLISITDGVTLLSEQQYVITASGPSRQTNLINSDWTDHMYSTPSLVDTAILEMEVLSAISEPLLATSSLDMLILSQILIDPSYLEYVTEPKSKQLDQQSSLESLIESSSLELLIQTSLETLIQRSSLEPLLQISSLDTILQISSLLLSIQTSSSSLELSIEPSKSEFLTPPLSLKSIISYSQILIQPSSSESIIPSEVLIQLSSSESLLQPLNLESVLPESVSSESLIQSSISEHDGSKSSTLIEINQTTIFDFQNEFPVSLSAISAELFLSSQQINEFILNYSFSPLLPMPTLTSPIHMSSQESSQPGIFSSELILPSSSISQTLSLMHPITLTDIDNQFVESSMHILSSLTSSEEFRTFTNSVVLEGLSEFLLLSVSSSLPSLDISLMSSSETPPLRYESISSLKTSPDFSIFVSKVYSYPSSSQDLEMSTSLFLSPVTYEPPEDKVSSCKNKIEFSSKSNLVLTDEEKNNVVTIHFHSLKQNQSLMWCEEEHNSMLMFIKQILVSIYSSINEENTIIIYIDPTPHYEGTTMIVITFLTYSPYQDLISGELLTICLRNATTKLKEVLHMDPRDIYNGLPLELIGVPVESSLFERHAGLLITVIVLAAWCLVVIIAGIIYVKCHYNRRRWRKSDYTTEKDKLQHSTLGGVIIENPNTDDEIIKDESQMLEKDNQAFTPNGNGSHLIWRADEEGWIIPYNDLTEDEKDTTEVEDTKL